MTERGSLYGTWMFARREIARYLNVWGQTLVPPVVQAALFLFVFGEALGGRIGGFGGIPYLTFLVPGLIVMGALQNAYSNTSSSFFDSRRARYIEDVLTSPLRDVEIVLAHVIAGTSRGMFVGIATYLIAIPFIDVGATSWLLALDVLVLACVGFSLLGLLVALRATRWDHIFVPVTFVVTPLTFLGGVFYPVSALPAGLETLSRFNPIFYIVDAQRAALLGFHDAPLVPGVIGLFLVDVALFLITVWAFGRSKNLRG